MKTLKTFLVLAVTIISFNAGAQKKPANITVSTTATITQCVAELKRAGAIELFTTLPADTTINTYVWVKAKGLPEGEQMLVDITMKKHENKTIMYFTVRYQKGKMDKYHKLLVNGINRLNLPNMVVG